MDQNLTESYILSISTMFHPKYLKNLQPEETISIELVPTTALEIKQLPYFMCTPIGDVLAIFL